MFSRCVECFALAAGLALLFIIVAASAGGLLLVATIASVKRNPKGQHLRPWIAVFALL